MLACRLVNQVLMPTIPPFRLLLSVRSLASVRKSGLTTTDCPVSLFPIYGLQKAVQTRDAYGKEFTEAVGGADAALPAGY